MERIHTGAALIGAVALLFCGAPVLAQADQGTSQVEATIVSPQGTARTVTGRVGGLDFANRSFSVSENNRAIAVTAANATISYNGQDANIYRLMGSPDVSVSGTFVPTNAGGNRGVLYANTVTITSGPTVRLERSAYTEQAQPAFSAGELGQTTASPAAHTTGTAMGTSRNYGYIRHTSRTGRVSAHRPSLHRYRGRRR